MSSVKDILTERILFYVAEHETVAEVVRHMAELSVGAIPVLLENRLAGVFSERDLMKRVVLRRLDPDATAVREVMTREVATIEESAPLEDAMAAMQRHNCRHLPVTRDGRVVGFLSMRDLMNYELARKNEELYHMQAYITGAAS